MPGITVAIDGSENSQRALTWAAKEAAVRNCDLTALTVHEVAANYWTGNPMTLPVDVTASRDSDLLVLGARGGGGFHPLSMGSISTQVVHHAQCPIVVVPGPAR